MDWNSINIALILLVLAGMLRGWLRGLLYGLVDLVAWGGSLLLGLRFYQQVSAWLIPRLRLPEVWGPPLAFTLMVLGTGLLITLLGHALLKRLPERVHRRPGNRLLGLVPGAITGLIGAAIVAALLPALPLPGRAAEEVRASAVAARLAGATESAGTALSPIFGEAIGQSLGMVTIAPDSDEQVTLPYTVADAQPRPDLEAQMLDLLNQERAEAGLPPLAPDPELTEVARRHSADMFARGYFAHVSPDGLDPFDRITAAGISYRAAGENLALAPTLSIAHTGLMNSPTHRDNVLRPAFGRVGIGIMDGGARGLMVTQNFRD